MKKLLITLIAISLVLIFAACDILDLPLSAPIEDEITDSSTSPESSKETEQSETELKTETKTEEETYYGGTHVSCEYCGKLEGDSRWFIGKVMENHLIMPLGTNCFEKNAAGDAGIDVWYKKVDGEERRLEAGEYVCISYGGYIMESYPVKINADDVSTVDIDFDEGHFEETTDDEGYIVLPEPYTCDMCGYDEKGNRFFTAIFKDDMAYPMCNDSACFEAAAVRSSEVGIYVSFDEVDGDPDKKVKNGDVVIITYNGMIMESWPMQIHAYSGVIIGYQDPESEQKKITDFLVDYGNLAVNMGDVEFFPIYGFVYSGPADGVGVDFYLEGIFGGEISDGDMPCITFEDYIYVKLNANQTLYTYCINVATKERNEINIDNLSSLPFGEYYIILRIATDMGRDSRCDEYIFKLLMRDNVPPIGDYVIVDMDTDRVYLELPISKIKIQIDDDEVEWLNWIDTALLIEADWHLTGGDSSFGGALWLTCGNYYDIYLNSELIVT